MKMILEELSKNIQHAMFSAASWLAQRGRWYPLSPLDNDLDACGRAIDAASEADREW